jgi:hypothetical protein
MDTRLYFIHQVLFNILGKSQSIWDTGWVCICTCGFHGWLGTGANPWLFIRLLAWLCQDPWLFKYTWSSLFRNDFPLTSPYNIVLKHWLFQVICKNKLYSLHILFQDGKAGVMNYHKVSGLKPHFPWARAQHSCVPCPGPHNTKIKVFPGCVLPQRVH